MSMNSFDHPLLSLCIPTRNRAAELRQMLDNLVSLEIFKNSTEIEVVISDNASTDDTEQISNSFAQRFPGRIRYFRNSTNLVDSNFGMVLSKGLGLFLKLSNDTLLHTESGLLRTLDAIRRYADEKPVLCFRCLPVSKPDQRFKSLDEFWLVRSTYSTWIAEFGIWQSDFGSANDFNRKADTHLTQVDSLLRHVCRKKDAVIVQDLFFNGISRPKIGNPDINVAKVFGTNYLDLLLPYVISGEIKQTTWDREKQQMFKMVRNNFLMTSPAYLYPKDHYIRHLLKYYRHEWYFWLSVPFVFLARIVAAIRRLLNF